MNNVAGFTAESAITAVTPNRPGLDTSPDAFAVGFRCALWVAVGFSAIGMALALALRPALLPVDPSPHAVEQPQLVPSV